MTTQLRWVAPPNWPPMPPGFQPAPGWEPDPSWPAPPPGWQFWQPVFEDAPLFPQKSSDRGKWAIAVIAVVGGLIAIGALQSASNASKTLDTSAIHDPLTDSRTAPSYPAAEVPDEPSPEAVIPAADQTKQTDKGWVLQSIRVRDDALGMLGAVTRVTNYNDAPATGVFTVTLSRDGAVIASMRGSANGVRSGQTVTVELFSEDKIDSRPFTYEFQTDVSY
jgi:hypothetical protein